MVILESILVSVCPYIDCNKKTEILYLCFKHNRFGGPAYTFLKHQTTHKLIDDLISLYTKLVELGVEYRNGEVYLADLEEKDV